MVLVLFLLGAFIFMIVCLVILMFSRIKFKIEHLEIENILFPKVRYDYDIQTGIYIFGKVPLINLRINLEKLKKSKLTEKLQKKHAKEKVIKNLDIFKTLKVVSPKIEELNLKLKIGTEDALYTSAIVFATSMLISLGLPHLVEMKNYEKIKYEISPLYSGKNLFSLEVNSIIYVKMVHIINIIYIYLQKRREEKHERASNRRSYANCNEQYSGYGRCKYNYRGTN